MNLGVLVGVLDTIGKVANTVVLAKDALKDIDKVDDDLLENHIVGIGDTVKVLQTIDTKGFFEHDKEKFQDCIDNLVALNTLVQKTAKIIK